MSYKAIEEMRRENERRFGRDVGPRQPVLADGAKEGFDLKSAVLRFVHERCEDLLFDARISEEEERSGMLQGTSIAPHQIPYNMQMDINRLCLERELERFIDSGSTEDAYNVYYCFVEIFFGSYGQSRKMTEMLSECEASVSTLLMDHRDHYSHSVYVFALGLAIYETNASFRRTFNGFYGFEQDGEARSQEAARFFLEFWGLTALFHDIGYPYELAFEQMMTYVGAADERGDTVPYIVYKNMRPMTAIAPEAQEQFEQLYGRRFATVNELFAFDVTRKLGDAYGFTEDYLFNLLERKPVAPEDFAYYMDHAYFGAVHLYRALEDALVQDRRSSARHQKLTSVHVDALTAVLLHYVIFCYSIAPCLHKENTSLPMELHPLAWLLIFCDELQCWDRTAYGRNTKVSLHPMDVDFNFRNDRIVATYLYDEAEQEKIDAYHMAYLAWRKAGEQGSAPTLKAYSSMVGKHARFVEKLGELVDLTNVPLVVACVTAPAKHRGKRAFLSTGSFAHRYDFAVALNARYAYEGRKSEVDSATLLEEFEALSLEYKLSNINKVKSFGRYLHAIRCFYTDRPVDFDMLREFSLEQIDCIAPLEHERWLREHQAMGWHHGTDYKWVPVPDGVEERTYRKALREQMRCHELVLDGELTEERAKQHYDEIRESDKERERAPFNSMLELIKQFEGLRIYQL